MLLIVRTFIITIYTLFICIFGSIYCLFSKNICNVAIFSHLFGSLSSIVGIKVELRKPLKKYTGNAIYISNHQNNYDMLTAAKIIEYGTVTIGKHTLIWIPFFGLLYWLSGNFFINRKNVYKSRTAIKNIKDMLKTKKISFWIFPEGTRNQNNNDLLPFKTGAFHIAMESGVPIIPIVVSDLSGIKLNQWNNGLVIVEMLSPVHVNDIYPKKSPKELSSFFHKLMLLKFKKLNKEILKKIK